MKRCDKHVTLFGGNNMVINFRQYLDVFRCLSNIRRPDKNHREIYHAAKFSAGAEAAKLPAVSVSSDLNVHGTKMYFWIVIDSFCQQNHAGAGAQDWDKPYLVRFSERER